MRELHHGGEKILAGVPADDAPSANKLGDDRQGHQCGEHDGHQRVEVGSVRPWLHAERDQQNARCEGADGRPQEISFQAFYRCPTPRQQRADCGQQQKQQSHRNVYAIEKRRSDRNLGSLNPL